MVDIPGDTTTNSTITVGGTVSDTLEFAGDHDWFGLELTAGQAIGITLQGISISDPYVRIRDSNGAVIYENDDWGPGLDSFVAFAAPVSGPYFIDVGSAPNNQTGTYQLSVSPYAPPPLATNDDIAFQLTNGYWNGDAHHFNASPGGAITVNLTGLTSAGQAVARAALAVWTDIIGVSFPEVGSGGQIVFDDLALGTGAFSESDWTNGIISGSTVNVSLERLGTGTGIVRIGLQTYIHEIAHAIGLGHAGDYNGGTAFSRYPYEAMFLNDGAAVSVMSYFDNLENSYYAGQGFTNNLVATPQAADILAAAALYGLSTTTRTGDTTYGFNNTSGREIFSAALYPSLGYTLFDSGGNDTLDYSGFATNQRINLNAETFSNVGPGVGNVSIARGVVIENAIGGSGSDTLIGNSVANLLSGRGGGDILTGGLGNDTFQDTAANLNGDIITDLGVGDRIVFTDASLADFTFTLSGSTLTFGGGSLTIQGGIIGSLVASAASAGGVQLTLQEAINDFNGDGRSDILWRNETGHLAEWLGQAGGTFAYNPNAAYQLDTSWQIVSTGDVNGDGRDDVLWRDEFGHFSEWLAQPGGTFAYNPTAAYQLPASWDVAATGDFNGDNRDDILWRNEAGVMSEWLAQPGGTFAWNPNAAYQLPTSWNVAATGDFNGDGRADLLWRNETGAMSEWLGQTNGTFAWNPTAAHQLPSSWDVAATGDFNGDNRDDLLWRNEAGVMSEWLANADGTFAWNPTAAHQLPTSWDVAATGDFNGDNRDDILWRNDVGAMSEWLAQANGTFAWNPNAAYQLPTSWHAEPENALL